MGLDNAITLKNYKNKGHKVEILADEYDEIAYWRKYWGFRNEVVWSLCSKYDSDQDAYEWKLDEKDLDMIISCLKYFIKDEDTFYSDGQSIWEYEHVREQTFDIIADLRVLIKEMRKDPEIEAWFYDSY